MKTLRKSYLDLRKKLQFDTKDTSDDSALCSSHGTLRKILELICNKPVEFNLRIDHGLNGDLPSKDEARKAVRSCTYTKPRVAAPGCSPLRWLL